MIQYPYIFNLILKHAKYNTGIYNKLCIPNVLNHQYTYKKIGYYVFILRVLEQEETVHSVGKVASVAMPHWLLWFLVIMM